LFFVGGAQTPLPLIHPTHLIFGGSVRGKKVKTSLTVSSRRNQIEGSVVNLTQVHKPTRRHRPGFDVLPLAATPRIGPAGRISGEGV
jgi:hypothetical protein